MTNQDGDRDRFVAVLATNAKLFERSRFYGQLLQAFCDQLMEARAFMRLVGCRHEYQRKHFLDTLGTQYTGIVFLSTLYRFEPFIRAVTARFTGPKVFLDHHIDGLPINSVQDDATAGMKKATEHLLELGHTSFAYLDMYRSEDNPWKREGVNAALREAGLPELDTSRVAGCDNFFEEVVNAFDWFMELDSPPTAILCFDDERALYALRAAAERGLNVPGDISIIGYGDTAFAEDKSRIITSVNTDPGAQGRKAADLIMDESQAGPHRILVEPDLIIRDSTAPPPKG